MPNALKKIENKIYTLNQLMIQMKNWKAHKKKVIFSNGCFDLIHLGHIEILARSSDLGDILIVAVNSDKSIKKIKGNKRPILEEESRLKQIAALEFVDVVVLFDEENPYEIIKSLLPNVIVKGGDYCSEDVIGNNLITQSGGEVIIIPLTKGYSTTTIFDKIKNE
jgi:rfaE bifunctional protein nucleotidyltransferase chain/domain